MAEDGGYRGRVGGRAAYALFLHRADERRLRIAGGRLGELLLLVELHGLGAVALVELGQGLFRGRGVLLALVVIDGGAAGEHELGVVGAEDVALAGGVHHDVVVHGVRHLACDEAAPDQAVEHVLLLGEVLPDLLGREGGVGGAYGLVRVLGAGLGLVAARLRRAVGLAVVCGYEAARGSDGVVREAQRVGTHVGYETHGAEAGDIHALIELLGDGHGAPGRHAQAAAGLLLEGRGYERGRGAALLFAALDALYLELLARDGGDDGVSLRLAVELGLALGVAEVAGGELAVAGAEHGVQQPVLLGHEGAYLLLPVHDHARRDGLHAACGEPAAYLLPQQRRELVAHYPVEDAARLLGVHKVDVYVPRRGDALGHHALCYLVEGDAAGLVVRQGQQLLQVPGDGLSLAVRVGREIDHGRLLAALLQVGYHVLLALDGDILRLKAVLYIHAHRALGQVPQVAHGGHDLVVAAQILLDGPGLGRGFDYDQCRLCFCH